MHDADILAARPPKQRLDPWQPYAYLVEPERAASGRVEDVATIFLTNQECPFRCTMCDLWKYTLDERVPVGAIPAQINHALARLPAARHIKLYNAGNFFDAQAIPSEDHAAIAARVCHFETIIVENHPRLTDDRCVTFRDLLTSSSPSRLKNEAAIATGILPPLGGEGRGGGRIEWQATILKQPPSLTLPAEGREQKQHQEVIAAPFRNDGPRLEVALGLETVHPGILSWLNKRMTVADFDRAAAFLRGHDIDVRAFLLLKPPGLNERDGIEWCVKSLQHAFDVGTSVCSVIPTRAGNGIMDRLAESGDFAPPTIRSLEEVLERGIELSHAGHSTRRVFIDLWDAEKFCDCVQCGPARIARLQRMNLSQQIEPCVECDCGNESK